MVSGSLSNTKGSEKKSHSSFFTYTEMFNEAFPYYLSIGMTYDQYWNDDPKLAVYYREAEEMRIDRNNQYIWLQGLYIYEALCDVAPIFNAGAKKGTKVRPYTNQPYAITERSRKQEEQEKERLIAEKGKKMMQMFATNANRRFGNINNEGG